jgi:hypothetical protein
MRLELECVLGVGQLAEEDGVAVDEDGHMHDLNPIGGQSGLTLINIIWSRNYLAKLDHVLRVLHHVMY